MSAAPRSGFYEGENSLLGAPGSTATASHHQQETTCQRAMEKGEPAGPPVAAARRLPPAHERLPPHRSHRATLEDGAGWSVLGAAAVPGTSPPVGHPAPFLRRTRSLGAPSRTVMGRAA